MRIGLNTTDPQSISPEQTQKPTTAAVGQPEASAVGKTDNDYTTVAQDSVTLSSLATQALSQPEVRQSLVDSLRQSVSNGEYILDPGGIADAILG